VSDDDDPLRAFGAKLHDARVATPSPTQPGKSMSQGELASIVGSPQYLISLLERGLRDPRLSLMCKLADAVGYNFRPDRAWVPKT